MHKVNRLTGFALMAATSLLLSVAYNALATTSTASGGAMKQVKVKGGDEPIQKTTNTMGFEDIPGVSTKIKVPAGTKGVVVARFSAESETRVANPHGATVQPTCNGVMCSVRIMIGDELARPAAGDDFSFAGYVERFRGGLPPGEHNVRVQWKLQQGCDTMHGTGCSGTFTIDDWTLTVERIAVP